MIREPKRKRIINRKNYIEYLMIIVNGNSKLNESEILIARKYRLSYFISTQIVRKFIIEKKLTEKKLNVDEIEREKIRTEKINK